MNKIVETFKLNCVNQKCRKLIRVIANHFNYKLKNLYYFSIIFGFEMFMSFFNIPLFVRILFFSSFFSFFYLCNVILNKRKKKHEPERTNFISLHEFE